MMVSVLTFLLCIFTESLSNICTVGDRKNEYRVVEREMGVGKPCKN